MIRGHGHEKLQPPGPYGRLPLVRRQEGRALPRSTRWCPQQGHAPHAATAGDAGSSQDVMIDPPADIARRLRRDARNRHLAERYWAGWKLTLTFGPIAEAFEPTRIAWAREAASELLGQPWTETESVMAVEHERNLWHLSVSWRGAYPADDGKRLLGELIVAMGVPEDKREGIQPMRVLAPSGASSPQVTHWIWREQARWGASRE